VLLLPSPLSWKLLQYALLELVIMYVMMRTLEVKIAIRVTMLYVLPLPLLLLLPPPLSPLLPPLLLLLSLLLLVLPLLPMLRGEVMRLYLSPSLLLLLLLPPLLLLLLPLLLSFLLLLLLLPLLLPLLLLLLPSLLLHVNSSTRVRATVVRFGGGDATLADAVRFVRFAARASRELHCCCVSLSLLLLLLHLLLLLLLHLLQLPLPWPRVLCLRLQLLSYLLHLASAFALPPLSRICFLGLEFGVWARACRDRDGGREGCLRCTVCRAAQVWSRACLCPSSQFQLHLLR
jgi:hypothetical protein